MSSMLSLFVQYFAVDFKLRRTIQDLTPYLSNPILQSQPSYNPLQPLISYLIDHQEEQEFSHTTLSKSTVACNFKMSLFLNIFFPNHANFKD